MEYGIPGLDVAKARGAAQIRPAVTANTAATCVTMLLALRLPIPKGYLKLPTLSTTNSASEALLAVP